MRTQTTTSAPATRSVTYWVDLWPGWQDNLEAFVPLNQSPNAVKLDGTKRVKVVVVFPCFGGSADVDHTVAALARS